MTLITGDVDSVFLWLSAITNAGLLRVGDSRVRPLIFLRVTGTRAETEEFAACGMAYLKEDLSRSCGVSVVSRLLAIVAEKVSSASTEQ